MARNYDSTRRQQQADETRRRILDAAVDLHSRGEFGFEALAEASGVPLPTVRKHFPNRERLFEGCTRHFFTAVQPPDVATLGAIADPHQRLQETTAAMCELLELSHDVLVHSSLVARESPALTDAHEQLGQLVAAAAAAIVDGRGIGLRGKRRDAARRCVRALLDPLTYHVFRTRAACDPATTCKELTALLGCAVGLEGPSTNRGSPP